MPDKVPETSLIEAIQLQVAKCREAYRMSGAWPTTVVDLPEWCRDRYRHDLAARWGMDPMEVSDRMMDEWAASNGLRIAFTERESP